MKRTFATLAFAALALLVTAYGTASAETYRQTVMDRDDSCPLKGGMGGGMMDDDCPMMAANMGGGVHHNCAMTAPGVNVDVKKTDTGVVVTYSSDDKNTARELQIMGEMMKLKQELMKLHKDKRGSVKDERKDRIRERRRAPRTHDSNDDEDTDKR